MLTFADAGFIPLVEMLTIRWWTTRSVPKNRSRLEETEAASRQVRCRFRNGSNSTPNEEFAVFRYFFMENLECLAKV